MAIPGVFFCLVGLTPARAEVPREMFLATPKVLKSKLTDRMGEERVTQLLGAIGILQYEPIKDKPKILTGFFFERNLFLSVRNPMDIHVPDCKSMSVMTGSLTVE